MTITKTPQNKFVKNEVRKYGIKHNFIDKQTLDSYKSFLGFNLVEHDVEIDYDILRKKYESYTPFKQSEIIETVGVTETSHLDMFSPGRTMQKKEIKTNPTSEDLTLFETPFATLTKSNTDCRLLTLEQWMRKSPSYIRKRIIEYRTQGTNISDALSAAAIIKLGNIYNPRIRMIVGTIKPNRSK